MPRPPASGRVYVTRKHPNPLCDLWGVWARSWVHPWDPSPRPRDYGWVAAPIYDQQQAASIARELRQGGRMNSSSSLK